MASTGGCYLRTEQGRHLLGNAEIELAFSTRTGAWLSLTDRTGGTVVAGHGPRQPTATITVGGRTTEFSGRDQVWSLEGARVLGADGAFRGIRAEPDEDGITLRVQTEEAGWVLTESYRIGSRGTRVERRLAIRYEGQGEELLRYAHLALPGIRVGRGEGCLVEAPGHGQGLHVPLTDLPEDTWGVTAPRPDNDCPGWQSGLILVHEPACGLCLMAWPYSELEPSYCELRREGEILHLAHMLHAADRFRVGHEIECGTQHIELCRTGWRDAMRRFHQWFDEAGVRVPADLSPWAQQAKLYEVCVGTFHFGPGRDYHRFSRVCEVTQQLDYIRELGFNTVQLMPRFPYPDYSVHDYFDVEVHYGPPDELKALVREAHERGMRVILDVVLHGCLDRETLERGGPSGTEPSPYLEREDWFVRDELGRVAKTYTLAFDHAHPEWREHLKEALLFYVRELDVDGFRVDAVTWNHFPNWKRGIGRRASACIYASASLFREVREELQRLKPGAVLYTESSGPLFLRSFDLSYNYDEQWIPHALAPVLPDELPRGAKTAREVAQWLEARDLALPPGAIRVHHLDSHDTCQWSGGPYRRETFGVAAARALFAFFALQKGGLMNFAGAEEGSEDFYRRVIAVRDELQGGEFSYVAAVPDDDMVFAMLWKRADFWAVPLINFRSHSVRFTLAVPSPGAGDYRLGEMLTGAELGTVPAEGLGSVGLEMGPYEVKVLRVERAEG